RVALTVLSNSSNVV
ncbi:hypothetical protein CP8484711_0550, partial [Chlamydia psittaci 84-8471/1]